MLLVYMFYSINKWLLILFKGSRIHLDFVITKEYILDRGLGWGALPVQQEALHPAGWGGAIIKMAEKQSW